MRLGLTLALSGILLSVPCFALNHVRRGPTSHKLLSKRSSRGTVRPASQRVIDPERATQIQTALIHSGYLSGEATGRWDAETESAMQRYQAANGWQTKLTPDSRAIIKLGLGSTQSTASSTDISGASTAALSSTLSSR